MLSSVILVLLTGLGFFSSVIADIYCSADVPCEIGCCGENNICSLGPDYCAEDKSTTNRLCDDIISQTIPQSVYSHLYFAFVSIDPDIFKIIPYYKDFSKFIINLKKALSNYQFSISITLSTSYWYLQHFDLESLNKSNDIKPSKINMEIAFYNCSVTLASSLYTEPDCLYLLTNNKRRLKAKFTKSKLAAALRNKINLNTTTSLTDHSFDERKSTSSSSNKGQDQYCRFINCSEVYASGFTEITCVDKKDLILNSSTCLSGKHQTQTLCCPTSTEISISNYSNFGDTDPPDVFTDCEWHKITFTNDKYCSTHCPAGSIRIAEEDISIFKGSDKTAQTSDCLFGREAYCCKDQMARELDDYLTMFLENPVCPSGWDSQYSYTYSSSLVTRDTKPITDEGVVLTFLVSILAAWATSQFPRQDLTNIITSCFAMFRYQSSAGNLTDLQGVIFGYGVGDGWIGGPITDVNSLMAGYLCNLKESANGLENIQTAASLLCESNDDSSSLSARRVTVVSMDDRSDNGEVPGISVILNGILKLGELSLHYCRWLSTRRKDTLELAFWIGPTPGVTPSKQLRSQYVDTSHTAATDRWIIFHLHFQIDDQVFYTGTSNSNRPTQWHPGVTTIDVYHSHTVTRPGVVTHGGRRADQRAEYRYSTSYDPSGNINTGVMQNYNARTHVLQCPIPQRGQGIRRQWYIGVGREREIAEAEQGGTRRPFGYAELLDHFGMWMWNQGIFSVHHTGSEAGLVPGEFTLDINTHNPSTGEKVLREEIIRRNDVETLKQYIGQYPKTGLEPEPAYYYPDVFFVATQYGCIDALRVLLAYYHANLDKAVPLERRNIVLLNVACKYSQLETAQFLLDSQPPLGNIHDKSPGGETALLSAAESFTWPGEVTSDQIKECLVRSEELMYMLLDRGASVNDVTMVQNEYNANLPPQPRDTVLSLAISRASYMLVKRLIEQGANIYAREEHTDSRFWFDVDLRDVTALHYGSIYWNIEGVKALLDHPGDAKIADMVSARDSFGRLPLHWAAIGDDKLELEKYVREDDIAPRNIGIFKILLTANPRTINAQDNNGLTALHYVVISYATGNRKGLKDIVQYLCENGADASISDYKGQTALHWLARRSPDCDPIDTAVIDLLIAHGLDIHQTDKSGTTALHIISMSLRQTQAVEYLLKLGADATTQDSEGNTPLHKLMKPAQDEITAALQKAGKVDLMGQPNAAGQTPQQLRAKIRARWQEAEEKRVERDAREVQGYGH
ncbi:hypothetical protein BDV41DRAFT_586825 [Aspergillus transmontanensis]|uniref:Uncharacterized protein n=1 Tax=Aspergillus transmontanensis TaxID=1034304 RepID=A0A5N6W3D1_9EURO|nr:hypothetical protein BDV41DRAFT_586825 [Aspergillus transmontanensis]